MSTVIIIDEERIEVVMSTIIIRVEAITSKTGLTIQEFSEKFELSGVTNGKIWVAAEMMFPWDYLDWFAHDILVPLGLEKDSDWVLTYERNCYINPYESGYLFREIPELEGLSWVDSIMLESGNWVWHK
ncbi:MAG: hypothetical protein HWE07_14670 [Cytophagia bacterium]|nr:hypothetical protein [Cytophagia bacterium]